MKLFLDDERSAPEGWIHVRWPEEAIEILKAGTVIELSLDHDLGDDAHGTGYDVILWIEQAVATKGFVPPQDHCAFSQSIGPSENGSRNQQHSTAACP